jgi:hypothetical protein
MLYFGVVTGVLYTGWHEPLRYRFLSEQQLAQERGVKLHQPTRGNAPPNMHELPGPQAASWRPAGTSLDRAPWDIKNGEVVFSPNYDHHNAGTPTEAAPAQNKLHSGPSTP